MLTIDLYKLGISRIAARWASIKIQAFLKESSFGFVMHLTVDDSDFFAFLEAANEAGFVVETRWIRGGNVYAVYVTVPEAKVDTKKPHNEAE